MSFFQKCIRYIENHTDKAFCSDIKFISCCFLKVYMYVLDCRIGHIFLLMPIVLDIDYREKEITSSISILCLLILIKLKIYKISGECPSIQQCVRLLVCQSDSLSATNLINYWSSIHDILHKSFTFPTGIPFGSSFQAVGRYYLTLGIIQCVT